MPCAMIETQKTERQRYNCLGRSIDGVGMMPAGIDCQRRCLHDIDLASDLEPVVL